MNVNWYLTLIKGAVIGALAMLGVYIGDVQHIQAVQGIPPWWAGLAVMALETIRDLIKTRFGSFVPKE
jgi:hypothetical protein